MPRRTVETLIGYGLALRKVEMPAVDPQDGHPLHDALGQQKTEPLTILVATCPQTAHTVELPLSEDARKALIEGLTGGITIPDLVVQ